VGWSIWPPRPLNTPLILARPSTASPNLSGPVPNTRMQWTTRTWTGVWLRVGSSGKWVFRCGKTRPRSPEDKPLGHTSLTWADQVRRSSPLAHTISSARGAHCGEKANVWYSGYGRSPLIPKLFAARRRHYRETSVKLRTFFRPLAYLCAALSFLRSLNTAMPIVDELTAEGCRNSDKRRTGQWIHSKYLCETGISTTVSGCDASPANGGASRN